MRFGIVSYPSLRYPVLCENGWLFKYRHDQACMYVKWKTSFDLIRPKDCLSNVCHLVVRTILVSFDTL